MKLTGRVCIVTGASEGLGLAIAERFIGEGATVAICARRKDSLLAAAARLAKLAGGSERILSLPVDVVNEAQVDAFISAVVQHFGRIDVLVNNAGIYGPMGTIEEVDWAEWVTALNINVLGTVYPCRAVIPVMKRQGGGKIINLSGGGATNPMPRVTAYATSKAAVVRFSESLALEVKENGIDVNAVAPGALATRLLDEVIAAGADKVGKEFHARMIKTREDGGTPLEKGAALCVYLASTESDGITGRLLSAVWDPWPNLQSHAEQIAKSDIYTLRRIVPGDRGQDWGG